MIIISQLIEQISDNRSREELERFWENNKGLLVGYAISRSESEQDAEDAVSAAMLRIIENREQFFKTDENAAVGLALYYVRIACREVARKKGCDLPLDEEKIPSPDAQPGEYSEYEQIKEAIMKLPEAYRQIIILLETGHNAAQIAKLLGISTALSYQRIHRARKALKKELEVNKNDK